MKQNPDYLNDEFEANDRFSTSKTSWFTFVYFFALICQILDQTFTPL